MQGTVLIIDDNADLSRFLKRLLADEGLDIHLAISGAQGREIMAQTYPDVVLMDIKLPDADGVTLMKELRTSYPGSQFVMMTAFGSIQTAIESMRGGALDYLTKPFNDEELLHILKSAIKRSALREEVRRLRTHAPDHAGIAEATYPRYPSPVMTKIQDLAVNSAQSNGNLLITGESGVGKNHLARWIHRMSLRSDGPFFDISCTALAPSLVESELFGHEPGAFTGSKGRKRGLLELADGGSLFLDEIGDMDPSLQSRLLAFLDTHTLRRVGGEKTIKVDARIIAATNRELEDLVREGRFRKDLYYRLHVLTIQLPPLRERKQDIPLLVQELCASLGREMGLRQTPQFTKPALAKLTEHDWPGNIRELRNALERAIIASPDKNLIPDVAIMPANNGGSELHSDDDIVKVHFPETGVSLKKASADLMRALIIEALRRADTKNDAAALLGISRFSLAHYIKTLGISE